MRCFYAACAGHIHTVVFGNTKLCIYEVKSLMVLNMSHIKWGDIPYCVSTSKLLGTCPPVPPVSAPMSQGNPSVAGGGVNATGVAKYSDFGPIQGGARLEVS